MKLLRSRPGLGLIMVILVSLFLLPTFIYLSWNAGNALRHSLQERRQSEAAALASQALVDYMRQFSQDYYSGHYDAASLDRNRALYEAGFTEVSHEAYPAAHALYIEARGRYGKDPAAPLAGKKLSAAVQFISDLTDYGTLINGGFTISASNVTYYGKWWITGNLSITGSNVRFAGGPLIVGGNLSVSGSNVRVDGDLYYGGSLSGSPAVDGTAYNFYPSDLVYPVIREEYYRANYAYRIAGTDRALRFDAHPSSSTFSIIGTTITVPVVESGMIVLGENVNLTVYGTVRGRVTVATTNTGGSKGRITVGQSSAESNLLYYNPLTGGTTTSAALGSSIALIASNGITLQGKTSTPAQDHTVCGVFFNRSSANISASGGSTRRLSIHGTRNKPISTSGFGGGTTMTYDTGLNSNPPPGLPERPVLVTWYMR
ncbi:MAG: hypothetical protein FD189_456 [Elusimicrobia bacterium]|nr:MAG: hypothetical protein FD154_509 [Elusimicrobiota bacterium]KAF0157681.1 MAG: hypothetical protein FD189_456 [Elusimicrobiota bacterium]